jgi:hypothetical protein
MLRKKTPPIITELFVTAQNKQVMVIKRRDILRKISPNRSLPKYQQTPQKKNTPKSHLFHVDDRKSSNNFERDRMRTPLKLGGHHGICSPVVQLYVRVKLVVSITI